MAKSDAIIDRIDLDNMFKNQNMPNWSKNKSINAFDTETYKGSVFMLSYCFSDGFSGVVSSGSYEEMDKETIFSKITHRDCRNAINFWYNLDFDANALLSGVLNDRQLTELSISTSTTTTVNDVDYTIKYVKGKFLLIQDEHDNKYPHYDVSQFFYSPLDEASKEWLDKEKIDKVETQLFGPASSETLFSCVQNSEILEWDNLPVDKGDTWNGQNAQWYINEYYSLIRKYAEKDAILTQELGVELVAEAEKLKIPMGKPFSTGYLSAEYFRANMDEKPSPGNIDYQQYFWDSYYGGRFEVFERGNIGQIVAPDINSAYPAVMADLPNPDTLDWQFYSNSLNHNEEYKNDAKPFDFDIIEKADYGVVNAIVTTNPNSKIQPFAYKINGKVNYPVLTGTEITVIKPIFEFAVKNDLVLDYELKDAWLGFEQSYTEYPFEFIKDLYAQRKVYEVLEGKYKKGQLLKIVLNSAYGKTCQTTEHMEIKKVRENEVIELEENEKLHPKSFFSLNQRNELQENEVVISELYSGRRFNPFFASYITGITRLKLHKAVEKYDLVNDTVMFATDCIMVKKEAYENSNFEELIRTPNENLNGEEFRQEAKQSLGMWDFDYEGHGFIVGSGVYEVEKTNGTTKTKTRGFKEGELNHTLKELAENNPEGIPIENHRPLTIAEVLISPERGNVSQFIKNSKELKPDFDDKRNWNIKDIDFYDLLNSSHSSQPINLANRQMDLLKAVQTKYSETEANQVENKSVEET
jgi:hypothetical protein